MFLPLLWCLVDELLQRRSGGGVNAQDYTDDICLIAVGKFPNKISGFIQWSLTPLKRGAASTVVS